VRDIGNFIVVKGGQRAGSSKWFENNTRIAMVLISNSVCVACCRGVNGLICRLSNFERAGLPWSLWALA
jgi:hypothetical protein